MSRIELTILDMARFFDRAPLVRLDVLMILVVRAWP